MKIILRHPFKLPKTYYTAIGEITYKWALVEFYIHDMARHFLGIGKKEGRVVLYKTGAREKITVLKTANLGWVSDKASRDHIKSIAKEAYRLNDRRNEIAHGVWGCPEGKPNKLHLLYVTEGKERILPTAEPKTSKDLQAIADEIDTLLYDIAALYIIAKIPVP